MFFLKNQHRVIEQNQLWYVETATGFEGPFEDKQAATNFARLCRGTDFARLELADLSKEMT